MKNEYDSINPVHYRKEKVQCIDAMRYLFGDDIVIHGCLFNIFKYLWRYQDKNGDVDIEKAKWYMRELKTLISINSEDILKDILFNMNEVLANE